MKQKTRSRLNNAARSVLRANKVCIINLNEPYLFQSTFHHGSGKLIMSGNRVASALCDISHHWTLYLAVFCDSGREKYTKAIEIAPQGIYKAERLTDVIREHHTDLVKAQNPGHVVSSGWIAFPYKIEFSESDADRLFDAAIEVSRDYENVKKTEGCEV